MVIEVCMPALSPTMTEGKIISWKKKEGDSLNVGDVLLEVETDKAVMEVESQNKGILGKILSNKNTTVEVGKVIALIVKKGEDINAVKNYKIKDTADKESSKEDNKNIKTADNNCAANDCFEQKEKNDFKNTDAILASPLAKKIAKINNIDIKCIVGHGPNGRIIKSDVEQVLKNNNKISRIIGRNPVDFVDVEPSNLRRVIANRLTESKQQIPHWYLKIRADMSSFLSFKGALSGELMTENKDPKMITVNDIMVMIVAKTLAMHPEINVSWANGKIRKYNNIDVSIAVAVNDGIYTPIVKNADQMSLIDIHNEIKRLVEKTRNGKLLPQEFQGGCISISNLGMYNVQEFYSIINQPQSCIIAVGTVEKAALVLNDEIVIRPVCNITLSADHRVIDGAKLALFANDLKRTIENPALILVR